VQLPSSSGSSNDLSLSERIVDCVIRSLDSKYGEGVRQVIFWKFQDSMKQEISAIASKPELFVDCMQQIFGTRSSSIEKVITEEISREFNVTVSGEPSLVRAIETLKSKKLKEDLTEN
jgi:hypothetical protein